jgi:hypothetical protein
VLNEHLGKLMQGGEQSPFVALARPGPDVDILACPPADQQSIPSSRIAAPHPHAVLDWQRALTCRVCGCDGGVGRWWRCCWLRVKMWSTALSAGGTCAGRPHSSSRLSSYSSADGPTRSLHPLTMQPLHRSPRCPLLSFVQRSHQEQGSEMSATLSSRIEAVQSFQRHLTALHERTEDV